MKHIKPSGTYHFYIVGSTASTSIHISSNFFLLLHGFLYSNPSLCIVRKHGRAIIIFEDIVILGSRSFIYCPTVDLCLAGSCGYE